MSYQLFLLLISDPPAAGKPPALLLFAFPCAVARAPCAVYHPTSDFADLRPPVLALSFELFSLPFVPLSLCAFVPLHL
jgi:hypothetical protein